ncbi:MAG TPA: hypothetical protein VGC96_08135 [Candidatus Elarobacter sp.]|jgi:hypothetical protein
MRLTVTAFAALMLASMPAAGVSAEPAVEGTWRGRIVDAAAGGGTMRVTIVSPREGGTWEATFSNAALSNHGRVEHVTLGQGQRNEVTFTIVSWDPRACSYYVRALVTKPSHMEGFYQTSYACMSNHGTFKLDRTRRL